MDLKKRNLDPEVIDFFDEKTNAASYIVKDPSSNKCAIIDSVLDFDVASGSIKTEFADKLVQKINHLALEVEWVIETHVHADHLSAAPFLAKKFSAKIAIGSNINIVQKVFGKIFAKIQQHAGKICEKICQKSAKIQPF